MLNYSLNLHTRSVLESCVRSTEHNLALSRFVTKANIACVHSDVGRIATVMLMHMSAIR